MGHPKEYHAGYAGFVDRFVAIGKRFLATARSSRQRARNRRRGYGIVLPCGYANQHFANIGAGIAKAGEAYNDAVGSYNRSVRPQGDGLLKLGSGAGSKELAEAKALDLKIKQP